MPILLHLFHRKTEVVIDFPAVSLLKRAPVQQHRRRRLRELLLLALRVAALILLLALSFARPYFAGAVAPDSVPLTVIAVDTSMSMSAPGQIDRARAAATARGICGAGLACAGADGFGDAATVVVEPTTDRSAIVGRDRAVDAERRRARAFARRCRARQRTHRRARRPRRHRHRPAAGRLGVE